jgi:diguanylate cyclase (GGDEF)-like protein/PAS domain S-box-containing protein
VKRLVARGGPQPKAPASAKRRTIPNPKPKRSPIPAPDRGRSTLVRDVAGRDSSRMALGASQARYRELFQSELFAVQIAEVGSWRLIDVNPTWLKLYGFDMPEALALTVVQLSAEPQATLASLAEAERTGRSPVAERWHLKKDGTRFPVEIQSTVFQVDGQQMLCSTLKDISVRVAAEQALRASEERYRNLFTSELAAFAIVDAETRRVVDANPAALNLLGYTREELLALHIADLSAEPEATAKSLEILNATGHAHVPLRLTRRKDGSVLSAEIFISSFEADGRRYYCYTARDVTERVAAERALRASEERYRKLFTNELAAVAIVDAESTRIMEANPAMVRMFGYSLEELRALRITELSAEPEATAAATAQAMTTGQIYVPLRLSRRKDGSVLAVEVFASSFEVDGRRYFCYTARDISKRVAAESRLRESEEKLRGLYELSQLGIALTDMQGRYIEFNEAFRRICGYTAEELKRLDYWTLTPRKYEADEARQLESLERSGHYGPYEKEYVRRDGTLVPVELNGLLIASGDGQKYIWSIVEDISERKRLGKTLAEREKYFRGLSELASDCYWEMDQAGRLTALVATRLPWLKLNHLGRTFSELPNITGVSAQQFEELKARMQRLESFRDFDFGVLDTEGQAHYLRASGMPVHDENGSFIGYRGMVQDITVQRMARLRAEYLALHDELTGLPNRVAMTERAQELIASQEPFGLLLVDLDRFKVINDSLGHHIGDAMLREVAKRLTVLPGRYAVFRLGGDEFVLLVATRAQADRRLREAVDSVLAAIEEPFSVNDYILNSGCSIGAATFPEDGATLAEILKDADTAMYQAKKEGSGGFRRYSVELQASAMDRLQLETDLRQAFKAERLELHYQPRVSLRSGALLGMEALLRWTHPQRGMVSPAEFVPIAEETGLILPIGEWVLRTACAQAKLWHEQQGVPLILAVNISPRQFHRGLATIVQRALAETGLPPQCLELEITESALVANIDDAIRVMGEITALGVRLALDDFGTGYSSLNHLKRFPLKTLKLDRLFVRDVADRPEDRVIVNSVVAMAHSLGLGVVAEGVETEAQRLVLLELGCDEFQGFLFSKALDPQNFAARSFGHEKAALSG